MSAMASQITSLTIIYSIVYLGADQRKHQSSALLVFVRGIHRSPVNSPYKGLVTRKMFPFDDVIMLRTCSWCCGDDYDWIFDVPQQRISTVSSNSRHILSMCRKTKITYMLYVSHWLNSYLVTYDLTQIQKHEPRTTYTRSILSNGKTQTMNYLYLHYRQVSNISLTLLGNKIVDHSDVVGASPVGAAPTTSSFLTQHLASMDCAKTTARGDEKRLSFGSWCVLY